MCRQELRKAGVSLTSLFSALSIKTLSLLLQDADRNPEAKPMTGSVGVDLRGLGTWGNFRDRRKLLPVVANYAIGCEFQVPFEEACGGDLITIAFRMKEKLSLLKKNVAFRAEELTRPKKNIECGYYCGVSSVMVPSVAVRKVTGFNDVHIDVSIDFGPTPRVWFYVVTVNKLTTSIAVDLHLPMEGLTKERAMDAVVRAARGSPLERLFPSRPASDDAPTNE